MTSRRWALLSALCFLASGYFLFYERLPVWVTDETPMYRATRNGNEGIVTTHGRIVVPFDWRQIGDFDEHGMARVVKETHRIHLNAGDPTADDYQTEQISGVIARDGTVVIPADLTDDSRRFDDHDEFIAVRNNQLVIFDRTGKERLRSNWRPLSNPSFGEYGLMAAENGDESGWINRNAELMLPAPPGLTPASNFYHGGIAIVSNAQGMKGCIDIDGNVVLAPEWLSVAPDFRTLSQDGKVVQSETTFVLVSKQSPENSEKILKGLFSVNGNCVVPAEFSDLNVDYEHQAIVAMDRTSKFGILDFNGKVIVPFEFDYLNIEEGQEFIFAARYGKFGWIDLTGRTVIPFEYDGLGSGFGFRDGRLVIACKDHLFGAIDSTGRVVVPFEYSDFSYVSSEFAVYVFCKDQKFGCFDSTGQQIIPFEYDRLGQCCIGNYFGGHKDGVSYFFDRFGKQWGKSVPYRLSDFTFDDRYRNRFLAISDKKGYGVYDVNRGQIVAPGHSKILVTEFGFLGRGIARSESAFDQSLVWSHRQMHEILPSLVPHLSNVEVFYDFDGNVLWRNDWRLSDILKAVGFLCYGLYTARKSYRVRNSANYTSNGEK